MGSKLLAVRDTETRQVKLIKPPHLDEIRECIGTVNGIFYM